MANRLVHVALLLLALIRTSPLSADEIEVGGFFGAQLRFFAGEALDDVQSRHAATIFAEPKFEWFWESMELDFDASLFARLDGADPDRNAFDIREALFTYLAADAEWRFGIGKVFWGSLESVHLVDIINQTDLAEDPDLEAKLGQPMVQYTQYTEFGDLQFFVLPFFRERSFPGEKGRLRTRPNVDGDAALYESGLDRERIDFAARWFHYFGPFDVGISYFHGISREPSYELGNTGGNFVLQPYYELIDQASIDVQAALGDWLLKYEGFVRSGQGGGTFARIGAGVEYTLYGILDTKADLGVIVEGLYDSSGNNFINPFEHDVVLGARLALNDLASTEILSSAIIDIYDGSTVYTLESSRRIGANWILRLEGQAFQDIPANDFPLNGFRQDHYLEITLEYYL